MSVVSRAEFARLMGVNKSTVTRWAEKGQIVTVSGQVDVEASRARLQETGGARPDVADRHAQERGQEVGAGGTAQSAPPPAQSDDRVGNSYQAARAVKEKYNALQAKLEYERQMGNLIPKEDVDSALKALGASVRARLDVLADQLAPVVAPVTDLDEVHAVLAEHHRAVLAGISDDLARQEHAA
jgi:phage terminase Nu1 subunit (DNA packaging protein)